VTVVQEPRTLTADQVRSFWANGYLPLEDVTTEDQREHLKQTLQDLVDRPPERRTPDFTVDRNSTSALRNINHFTRYWIAGSELIRHPRILGALQDLLGADVRFHHTKVMLKRPYEGTTITWHQDLASYVEPDERQRLIALGPSLTAEDVPMIAVQHYLDDATLENGCLCFARDTHRQGLAAIPQTEEERQRFSEERYFPADQVLKAPVKAGSAVLFHSLLFHYSGPNQSPRPRRGPIVQYFAPPQKFTLSSGDDQPDLPHGERLITR